ncbi:hypothetical protein [Oceanobacillus jeddahense]|uniref:hypothetical protein n=1 Tax=Oceanobacillus jeddahense TaxID=1462527 RepID=UPI000595987D|nr:hypothetical protein [Oceanobacillus jeddahense]
MKDKAEKTLEQLIKCYENDLQIIDGLNEEQKEEIKRDREDMLQMIIKLTSWIHDIRYCSNKECKCSPESNIRIILERNGELFKNPYYLFPVQWKTLFEIAGLEAVK